MTTARAITPSSTRSSPIRPSPPTPGSEAAVPSDGRPAVPPFAVITGAQVQHALRGREKDIVAVIENAYRLHGSGASVDPPSSGSPTGRRPGSSRCPPRWAATSRWRG